MVDYRTTKAAVLTPGEREWIRTATAAVCEGKENPVVIHIGVEYGGSLHCSRAGAPHAQIIGVDLDISKCVEPDGFTLLKGNSGDVARQWDGKIDFLFVDGDHTRHGVYIDIAEWAGRVGSPGVIAFHDYGPEEWVRDHAPWVKGVKEAVDDWCWSATAWQEITGVDSIKAFGRKPPLRRGQPFGTIGIGVPYYKASYHFWRWWTWLILAGLEPGDHFLNTQFVPGEVPIPLAHNALVAEFLRSDRDTLCIVEDDHSGEQGILRAIRNKEENWNFDVVCASYVSRREPLTAVGCNLAGSVTRYGEYDCEIRPMDVWRSGTQPVDVACLGLVLIRRWVLEALVDGTLEESFWFDWNGRNSQDVVFYAKVKELGAKVGVDRDNAIVHWGYQPFTMSEYYKRMDKVIQEAKNASSL